MGITSQERALPDWAVEPILGLPDAALVLGVSVRKLSDILQEHPYYERRGRQYAFYPEHIAQLRAVTCRLNFKNTQA